MVDDDPFISTNVDPRDAFMFMLQERIIQLEQQNVSLTESINEMRQQHQLPDYRVVVNGSRYCSRFVIHCRVIAPQPDVLEKFAKVILDVYPNAEVYSVLQQYPERDTIYISSLVFVKEYINVALGGNALAIADTLCDPDKVILIFNLHCTSSALLTMESVAKIQNSENVIQGYGMKDGALAKTTLELQDISDNDRAWGRNYIYRNV